MQKIKKDQFSNRSILSIDQFTPDSFNRVFNEASALINEHERGVIHHELNGKIVTLLFYEPSSRTFSSFSSAAKRMGAQTVEYQNPTTTSSYVKGETMEDTIRVFANYSDCIVMRHFTTGIVKKLSRMIDIPMINAGDGSGEHPTQALLDMFTLHRRFGRLHNLKGLIAGDLLYGRTVHSLIKGLGKYQGNTLYLLAPERLKLPPYVEKEIKKMKIKIEYIKDEKSIPKDCNFWYWTRVQKERFSDPEEYEKLKKSFVITPSLLKQKGNANMVIMHPLPRIGEIDIKIDKDPRALYLSTQVKNGMYVRMALLKLVLG
ncbi:MAG: aspartate carbamoyltransferase [Candidatus Roizmanbacteria bacterium]|nr:aspartate carbamoyltransferase [Candidatus Roizmanbacteria bacterium]